MGEKASQRKREVMALQCGLERGLKLIDIAEMYADGEAKAPVGDALKGRRETAGWFQRFIRWNTRWMLLKRCERSLKRMKKDYLNLYFLHRRGNVPLSETITTMEYLQQSGKIPRWGVSNFDCDDMAERFTERGGDACAANQVLYHLASLGIEYDLLPQCQQFNIAVMAYSPQARAGRLQRHIMDNQTLQHMALHSSVSVAQLLLAWVIRVNGVVAIPKASSVAHGIENATALDIVLSNEEQMLIDHIFPPPKHKMPLDVV